MKTKLLVLILALLICNAARGLASRLAGGLALATATVLNGLCNILSFDSIDSLHYSNPPSKVYRLTLLLYHNTKILSIANSILFDR